MDPATVTPTEPAAVSGPPEPEHFTPTATDINDIDKALDIAEKASETRKAEKGIPATSEIKTDPEVSLAPSRPTATTTKSPGRDEAQPLNQPKKDEKKDGQTLSKTEITKEAKPDTAPAPAAQAGTPPAPTQTPPQHADPEIDGIEKPKGLSPLNNGNWDKLREVAHTHKKASKEKDALIAQLSAEKQKIPEPLVKELTELREFRKIFDIQNDPEFKTRFDSAMVKNEEDIVTLFKQCGMPEDSLKEIMDAGGISAYSMSFWEEKILKPLRESQDPTENAASIVIENKLKENVNLAFSKQMEIKNAAKNQSEFFKRKEEAFKKQNQEDINVMTARISEVEKQFPFLKTQEIPDNATPEQKAIIEEENKMYEQTKQRFAIALKPQTAQQRVETAIAACTAFYLSRDLERANARIQYLEEQSNKLKSAGQTNRASAAPVAPGKTTKTLSDLIHMKSDAAVDALMDEAGL